jgi:hypothetical protein
MWTSKGNPVMDYDEILRKLEEVTKVISDESLRRIAFERLLEHELSAHKTSGRAKSPEGEPKERATRPRRQRGKASPAGPPPAVRESVKNLGISPDEEGLPAWNTLGALDKYLWILEAAHQKNVDGLTSGEIGLLINETFKENHGPNQVSNLKTRIKQGHVRTTKIPSGSTAVAGYQILKGGIEHLQKLASGGSKK